MFLKGFATGLFNASHCCSSATPAVLFWHNDSSHSTTQTTENGLNIKVRESVQFNTVHTVYISDA